MSNRACQVCPMRAQGFQLQYLDPGYDVHLGHYHVRYRTKKGEPFWLWAQHVCCQCKSDGTLISRLTFSAPTPFTLPLFSTPQEKLFPS